MVFYHGIDLIPNPLFVEIIVHCFCYKIWCEIRQNSH